MAVEGKIADSARSELPLTWKALAESPDFGDSYLEDKIQLVEVRLFGSPVPAVAEAALDKRVIDIAGKFVALEIINAGIDYWGKQATSIGAAGRNEQKAYANRANDLRQLREYLLSQTRLNWPEVEAMLPGRSVKNVANMPRVAQITSTMTPDPFGFERPFADPTTTA